ncbi:tripartite tricarboxylate transporter TctB family protein [Arthrobacter pigmenti]
MVKAKRDIINAAVILLFSGIIYFQIQNIPQNTQRATDAAFFPRLVVPALAALGMCLLVTSIVRAIKQPNEKLLINPKDFYRSNYKVIWVFGGCALYLVALQYLGFIISTPLFLVGVYLLIAGKTRKPWIAVIGYVVFAAVIYVVFQQFLSVFLPTGQLL